jgi:hypothetical protein
MESLARKVLAGELLDVQIATPSGAQALGVLRVWAIPMWLTGIQISRAPKTNGLQY